MGESKKKSTPTPRPEPPSEGSQQPGQMLSHEEMEALSTLQLVDFIAGKLPPQHSSLMDLIYLRDRITALEEMNEQARQALEKLDEIVEKLRSPAFRIGTFLMPVELDKAHVCIGGTDYVCRVDPKIPLASLQMGQRVLCNEAFAVVQ